MSGLTAQWLGMSSLQSKCIKLVWRTQSTCPHCYRGMKDLWHSWERRPYRFKSLHKLKLMGGKWMFFMSPLLTVFQVRSSCKSVNPLYYTPWFSTHLLHKSCRPVKSRHKINQHSLKYVTSILSFYFSLLHTQEMQSSLNIGWICGHAWKADGGFATWHSVVCLSSPINNYSGKS